LRPARVRAPVVRVMRPGQRRQEWLQTPRITGAAVHSNVIKSSTIPPNGDRVLAA